MRHIIFTKALVAVCALPMTAQEAESPEDLNEGFSLMEEGAKLLLRGLMTEMEPTIQELEGMTDEMGAAMAELGDTMGPALVELMARIDDMRNYDAPEVLANGDIIIRRSADAPTYVPPAPEEKPETGEIDL